jgi:hypothetical protein
VTKQIQSESKMIQSSRIAERDSRDGLGGLASTRGLAPQSAAVPVPLLLSWPPSIEGITICRDCVFLGIPVYNYGRIYRLP